MDFPLYIVKLRHVIAIIDERIWHASSLIIIFLLYSNINLDVVGELVFVHYFDLV
jgi:hypothetical protein